MDIINNELRALQKRVEKVECKTEEVEKRINAMDKDLSEVRLTSQKDISQIFALLDKIEKNTDKTNTEVEILRMQPAKKWDSVVMYIITSLISSVLTFIVAKGGF